MNETFSVIFKHCGLAQLNFIGQSKLEEEIKERDAEIELQKGRIEKQEGEIAQQQDTIAEHKRGIESMKEILDKTNGTLKMIRI